MSGERSLVTGATGYVGSQLVQRLIRDGENVSVIVRKDYDRKKLDFLSGRVKVYEYDGSDLGMLDLIKKAGPEIVYHLASRVQVEHRVGDIKALIESNILFGTQLLEGMVQTGVRFFINIGSYWQHYQGPAYNPVNLYAATKQAFQDLVRFYKEAYDLCAVTLKLFDVYGPHDSRSKIFRQLEDAASTGKPLPVSQGEQLLDLVYIDDVTRGICHAAKLLKSMPPQNLQEDYAISSLKWTSLKDVVALYEKMTGKTIPVQWGARPYRKREVMEPWRGRALPGWEPQIDLQQGIQKMISSQTEVEASTRNHS